MPEPTDQPAKPVRTWRPIALWVTGSLLALGLVCWLLLVPAPIDLSTPEGAWKALLAAMKSGDEQRIAAVTTRPENGYLEIDRLVQLGDDYADRLATVARRWGASKRMNWSQEAPDCCVLRLSGDKPSTTCVRFKNVQGQWKCAGYGPGK